MASQFYTKSVVLSHGQIFLADGESIMKASFAALGTAMIIGSLQYVAPSVAAADPSLSCVVTPGGIPSTTRCTTNFPAPNYNAQYTLSGLPAGSYSYSWTATDPSGLEMGCGAVCNLGFSANGSDYSNEVTVTATNVSTAQEFTLSTRVRVLAVCGSSFC